MREIEQLLPSIDPAQFGFFPLIASEKMLALTDLIYHITLAYHHEW
jgi:hypothetical protein